MPVQDDKRENQMIQLFNLSVPEDRKRSDIDAHLTIDGQTINFELKSSTGPSVSTVRDFGREHIRKWRDDLHWIFAFYDKSGDKLKYCVYASPADMEPWIASKEAYIHADLFLADHVPGLIDEKMLFELLGSKDQYSLQDAYSVHKKQWRKEIYLEQQDLPNAYSPQRMTEILRHRARYVIERGSTLNNPHIESAFFSKFERIESEHAATLRKLVREYMLQQGSAKQS